MDPSSAATAKEKAPDARAKLALRKKQLRLVRKVGAQRVNQAMQQSQGHEDQNVALDTLQDMCTDPELRNIKPIMSKSAKPSGVDDAFKRMIQVCTTPEEMDGYLSQAAANMTTPQYQMAHKYVETQKLNLERTKIVALPPVIFQPAEEGVELKEAFPDPTAHRSKSAFTRIEAPMPDLRKLAAGEAPPVVAAPTFEVPAELTIDPSLCIVTGKLFSNDGLDDNCLRKFSTPDRQAAIDTFVEDDLYSSLISKSSTGFRHVLLAVQAAPAEQESYGAEQKLNVIPEPVAAALVSQSIVRVASENAVYKRTEHNTVVKMRDYSAEITAYIKNAARLQAWIVSIGQLRRSIQLDALLDILEPFGVVKIRDIETIEAGEKRRIIGLGIFGVTRAADEELVETPCVPFVSLQMRMPTS